jgi:hypothetical protein
VLGDLFGVGAEIGLVGAVGGFVAAAGTRASDGTVFEMGGVLFFGDADE